MNVLLSNKRINLRAPEPEDLDIFYQWENDTSLWEHGPTLAPISRFVLREYLRHAGEDIYSTRQLRMMIEKKEDQTPIGTIDLYDFDPYDNRAFLGMLIDPKHQGKGYGTEAVELMIKYCFEHLHLHQICAHIAESNKVSLNLYQKMGFTQCGLLKEWTQRNGYYENVYFMQLIQPNLSK